MGAYQIFQFNFKSIKDRNKFESLKLGRRLFQYNYLKDNMPLECTYYMGWDGYALGQEVLIKLKKLKVIPTHFLSLDLSTASEWYDELKQQAQRINEEVHKK